ncbi:ABC transporter permease [Candidatus Aeolococcus gillhamiae]|uniref:sugar ABC transporter permease n=1 Tax=Candidatus Aeolococcus gillhamiae TaxID=3127015 RepID=UPI0030782322
MTALQSAGEEPPAPETAEAAAAAELVVPPSLVAQSLGEYLRGWAARVRNGDSGVLPVLVGMVLIAIVFEAISPSNVFLDPKNLVNLFQQSAVFMVLAMAECFVLLLGEIDLSVGYSGPLAGVIAVQLVQPSTTNWHWLAAIAAALLALALWGLVMGSVITRVRVPSFIVTLAGFLILNGVVLIVLSFGPFSGYPSLNGNSPNQKALYDLMNGSGIDPTISWIVMIIIVGLLSVSLWLRDARRRRSGLVAPPRALTMIKIVAIAVVGVVVVAICNVNRANFGTVAGVPWVIPVVLGVFALWMLLLERTRFGRYIYAIGGNPEAARRAGISLARIRTIAFILCSVTAGIAGILYVSYLGGASNNINGGQLTLYAVAAAVIGGTSLFGGRGRVLHGLLGGLVIGGIYNGMFLLGLHVEWEFIVTGLVLLVAVAIDSLSRRSASVARA